MNALVGRKSRNSCQKAEGGEAGHGNKASGGERDPERPPCFRVPAAKADESKEFQEESRSVKNDVNDEQIFKMPEDHAADDARGAES